MPVSMSFKIFLVSGGISAITSSFHASGNTRNRSRYGTAATFFWKSDPSLVTPDLQPILAEVPFYTPETAYFSPPADSWSMLAGLVRPRRRGYLRVAGPNPTDTIEIVANTLAGSADMKALIRAIELCREIGNSSAMSPFAKREVMPGNQTAGELESFARNAVSNFWHQACTAKMGRDEMSVVDSQLRVYGIDCLRIADASIMPRHHDREHDGYLRRDRRAGRRTNSAVTRNLIYRSVWAVAAADQASSRTRIDIGACWF